MTLKHAHIYVGCVLSPLLTDPPQIFLHQSVSPLIICQPYIACRCRVPEFKGAAAVFSAILGWHQLSTKAWNSWIYCYNECELL